ncbi:flagellar type III secretion system protein FlhB [Pseudothioclava nitratireducens]|uniref:flagellar type III secretion system protein FlhB n=1 Tax=Pseudothioclava nitratireducens TaxID=1928646 RepID=UPI0023DA51C5|nr:flagellar type III secretion system protein FlhB [Defluviimonas nitratireducens]MDF1619862.1 flagellar type III secretion system protein FlhB [Defluviimonas nitratireducens]
MSEEDDSEKEFEPTPQKLEEARKKGDLVKSAEISVAASYGGLLIVLLGLGATLASGFGRVLSSLIENSDTFSEQFFIAGSGATGALMLNLLGPLSPWFLVPLLFVLGALMAQRAIVFAPEKLMPKMNRIDPIKNAGQKFGRNGFFEFLKSAIKLTIIAVVLGVFLMDRMDEILTAQYLPAAQVVISLAEIIGDFLLLILIIAAVMGAIDYLWQRAEFLRRNRMSRKELTDQMKQSEGDPHMKAQRRQKGIELATKQMLGDVATADVVVVNPTHYAVALKWDRAGGRAPVCVAKGVDELAARIREIAAESGVPIHSDPPTARALYATIEVGAEIRPEHYKAVAAAIRFAERIRRAARAMGRR